MSELITLLGKKINSEAIINLRSDLKEEPGLLEDERDLYWEFPARGLTLLFDHERRLKTIFLYSEGRDGYKQYVEELPAGLSFSDTYSSVLKKLGNATNKGGGGESRLYATVPQWIKYDYHDYKLHIEFKPKSEQISLITLIRP